MHTRRKMNHNVTAGQRLCPFRGAVNVSNGNALNPGWQAAGNARDPAHSHAAPDRFGAQGTPNESICTSYSQHVSHYQFQPIAANAANAASIRSNSFFIDYPNSSGGKKQKSPINR